MKKRMVVAAVLAVLMAASAYGQADFFELVKTGTPQDVRAAISKGADVTSQDSDGMTPLLVAAKYNQNPEVIVALLKAGADIKAQDRYPGATALMWAAMNNRPEVITVLLKAGADIKARDKEGATVLMHATLSTQDSAPLLQARGRNR
jgi:ankyrin repeat protein